MEIKCGSIIISSAGHDSGRPMVVVGAEGGFVFVADGKERKLDSPKKKNIKHVRRTLTAVELEGLTDKKLRQTLRSLNKAFAANITQDTLEESE